MRILPLNTTCDYQARQNKQNVNFGMIELLKTPSELGHIKLQDLLQAVRTFGLTYERGRNVLKASDVELEPTVNAFLNKKGIPTALRSSTSANVLDEVA